MKYPKSIRLRISEIVDDELAWNDPTHFPTGPYGDETYLYRIYVKLGEFRSLSLSLNVIKRNSTEFLLWLCKLIVKVILLKICS